MKRPLSPHLMIYKPQLTSILSIAHRGTGVFLSIGLLFLPCWLWMLAKGPLSYAFIQAQFSSYAGQGLLLAFIFSFYYHLCNGVRHLFWDMGLGLELKTLYRSGYAMLFTSCLLTWLTVIAGGIF